MTEQKKIAIDLDGTLVDFTTPLVVYTNKLFNTNINPEDITTYDFESSPKVRQQIPFSGWFEYIHDDFIKKGMYKDFNTFPNAKEGLEYLKEVGYDLIILTSRDINLSTLEEDTIEFVQRKFSGIFSDIYFKPNGNTKAEICRYFGVRALIEDHLHNLTKLKANGILKILVDQPYNRTNKSQDIKKIEKRIVKEGDIYRINSLSKDCLKHIPF